MVRCDQRGEGRKRTVHRLSCSDSTDAATVVTAQATADASAVAQATADALVTSTAATAATAATTASTDQWSPGP
jgi:hypothetical protein